MEQQQLSDLLGDQLVTFNPSKFVNKLLAELSSREREVLERRYGISKPKDTLESIGKDFGVTRERVRQIEIGSVRKLKKSSQFSSNMAPVKELIGRILEIYGGMMEHEHLLESLGASEKKGSNREIITFIVSRLMDDYLKPVNKHKELLDAWKLRDINEDVFVKRLRTLLGVIEQHNEPLSQQSLYSNFHEKNEDNDLRNPHIFESHLKVSRNADKNIFGHWGLSNWSTVKPKRMNDKIYIVLKKQQKPLHFSEIAKKINDMNFDHKVAYPATVHNELILDKKYVLVGRGIYALQEWGYKHGVVADVVADILRDLGPLTRDQIVDEVLKQRLVGKSTIHLSLMNKKRFERLGDGRYQAL